MNVSDFKVLLWDFDGVILDSNSIRDMGFIETLADYPDAEVEQLIKFHHKNGGLSRYVKFRYFLEEVRGGSCTEEQILKLASRFSEVILEKLIDPERLIEDTIDFIRENYRYQKMHIVSGSDQMELRQVCKALGIDQYFHSIHGSPTLKIDLVRQVLDLNNYDSNETALIGDSINDWQAAVANDIFFYGYNNESLKKLDVNYIAQFTN